MSFIDGACEEAPPSPTFIMSFRTSYTLLRPLQRLSIVSFLFDKAKGASLHIIKPRLVVVGLSSNYALIIPLKFYYEWFCWTYTFYPETRGHFSNSQTTIPNLVFLVALTSNCACFFYPFSFDGHLSWHSHICYSILFILLHFAIQRVQ